MGKNYSGILSENDYLAILALIRKLGECQTRLDLNLLLENDLLKIMDSTSCFYAFTDPDFAQVKILDAVNIPQCFFEPLQDLIEIDQIGHNIVKRQRPVMSYDVDFPRKELATTGNELLKNHPEHSVNARPYLDNLCSALGTVNLPDATIGFGIHRLKPNDKSYTAREVRMLELIQPTLLQTVRSIVLTEELNRYRSFAESLTDVSSPVTLLDNNWQVLYRNQAFDDLFPRTNGILNLPDSLLVVLQNETSRFKPNYLDKSNIEIPFYLIDHNLFRLNLTRINIEINNEKLWLLRMLQASDPYSGMLHRLQDAGLTSREIEICLYIRDGFGAQEIADRFYISYHTVRNHLRKIYDKVGVNSRARLVAFLNQDS